MDIGSDCEKSIQLISIKKHASDIRNEYKSGAQKLTMKGEMLMPSV